MFSFMYFHFSNIQGPCDGLNFYYLWKFDYRQAFTVPFTVNFIKLMICFNVSVTVSNVSQIM